MRSSLRQIFALERLPWAFLAVALAATIIQLHGGWREILVYDRSAIAHGEWWRIWSGHLIHFGWPHFVADVGLFLILGRLLEWQHPWLARFAILAMPVVISATIYWFDPTMTRYGGLSAVNIGLLLFLALQGWQRSWVDWFWPAVLVIYVGEIILEATRGHGHGGGMIAFDDSSVRVATIAHIGGSVYGVLAWLGVCWRERRSRPPA